MSAWLEHTVAGVRNPALDVAPRSLLDRVERLNADVSDHDVVDPHVARRRDMHGLGRIRHHQRPRQSGMLADDPSKKRQLVHGDVQSPRAAM